MMVDTVFSFLIGVTDPACALIIIWILFENPKIKIAPTWHRLGLVLIAAGLIAQSSRDWYFIFTGISLHDNDLPLWALKDIGVAMLAFYYLWLRFCKKRKI